MTDDFDLGDIVGDSNAGAYQKTESRQGPPLAYVSEKLENALGQAHRLVSWITRDMPDSRIKENLSFSARYLFQQQLVAFLALHNLLGLANNPELSEDLLTRSHEEFQEWLQDMRAEGSVTG